MPDLDREWTQAELREYLVSNGMAPEKIGDDPIPQGVKWINFVPLTPEDIAWAKRVIAEHPEWERR